MPVNQFGFEHLLAAGLIVLPAVTFWGEIGDARPRGDVADQQFVGADQDRKSIGNR